MLLQRTGVFAGAASHAAAGIDARLFEGLDVSGRIDDLRFLHVDGLGRDRAPLFADDAIGGHGPGQTTAAVIGRCAQTHRLVLLANADHPALLPGRNLPDGSGGANLGTEHATGLAIADARHQSGRPEAFETGLVEAGMERGVGANLHALAAADAPGEEVGFVERAGRADEAFMTAFAQAGVGAHEGHDGHSGSKTGEGAPAAQIRRGDFFFIPKEAELQAVVRAGADAVHAHEALRLAPGHAADRIVAALATEQAAVAFVAGGGILVQTKNRPAGHRAEERT